MADINLSTKTAAAEANVAQRSSGTGGSTEPIWDIIELLFFAYRDFVGDPDEVLLKLGFGRAHHRVLPDRIEAGTYATAVAMTGGDIVLEGVSEDLLEEALEALTQAAA